MGAYTYNKKNRRKIQTLSVYIRLLHTQERNALHASLSYTRTQILKTKSLTKKKLTNQSINDMNPREAPSPSEKPKQDGEAEHDEPDDLDQKEGLARDRARLATAIADLAEPHLGDRGSGAGGVGAATPVGHAIGAADRVGPEAVHGAGRGLGLDAVTVVFI